MFDNIPFYQWQTTHRDKNDKSMYDIYELLHDIFLDNHST